MNGQTYFEFFQNTCNIYVIIKTSVILPFMKVRKEIGTKADLIDLRDLG